MKNDVYSVCPTYQGVKTTLRQTVLEDADELLKCYSDRKAAPFFNSDHCNGDDFYYQTVARMQQTIQMWNSSYAQRLFVRWTVIDNDSGAAVGTVEMFHRTADDDCNHFGLLRIDLRSEYEKKEYIGDILEITNARFYTDFDVAVILTKAIPAAFERISALRDKGYLPFNRKLMTYDDYFMREQLPLEK